MLEDNSNNSINEQPSTGFPSISTSVNYSCSTALAFVIIEIVDALEIDDTMGLVLLDWSKEFDSINYEILLSLLRHTGLSCYAILQELSITANVSLKSQFLCR